MASRDTPPMPQRARREAKSVRGACRQPRQDVKSDCCMALSESGEPCGRRLQRPRLSLNAILPRVARYRLGSGDAHESPVLPLTLEHGPFDQGTDGRRNVQKHVTLMRGQSLLEGLHLCRLGCRLFDRPHGLGHISSYRDEVTGPLHRLAPLQLALAQNYAGAVPRGPGGRCGPPGVTAVRRPGWTAPLRRPPARNRAAIRRLRCRRRNSG